MTGPEILLVAMGVALAALFVPQVPRRARALVLALCVAAGFAGAAWAQPPASTPAPGPARSLRGVYAGSEACRSCHPAEHASFARTFHRTMTQRATPQTMLAPVPGENVVLTTGSHHYQAYWVEGARPGELRILPFVYLIHDRRFVPRAAVFLTPDDAPPNQLPWSASCIQCHAVGGRPRRDERGSRFDTDVAELGIACESCHGPGAAHAEALRDPVTRALARADRKPDPNIVDPAKLDARGATNVCAQCHSLSLPKSEATFWNEGVFGARPDRPWDTRDLLTYESLAPTGDAFARVEAPRESLFWRDGTIRVGGREAHAHFLSPCFADGRGEHAAACTSCHSMHDSEPVDQLARGKEGDGACAGCHASVAANAAAHTHHAPSSAGARCVSCHMPKTTFALLGAIRTHRIEVPDVDRAREADRLPACNLCHLDRSLAWTDRALATWYGRKARTPVVETNVGAAVAWLLAGDAAKRALAAAHFGDDGARAASGVAWQPPLLGRLLDDPYAAVRYVAARSLRSLAGYEDLTFDFVGSAASRREAVRETMARARAAHAPMPLSEAMIEHLSSQRDDRAITIAE